MNESLLLFILTLSFAGFISLILGLYIWKKETTLRQQLFTVLMLLSFFWCFIYILELVSPSEQLAILLSNIKFIAVALIPPTFCLFTIIYTELEEKPSLKSYFLFYIIPFFNIGLIFTNHLHHLFWISKTAVQSEFGIIIQSTDAAFFWFHTTYSYLLLFFGFIFIIKSLFYSRSLYSKQAVFLIAGIIAPIIGNIIIIFRLYPIIYDITPIFFAITGSFFSLAIFHYQLFSIVPIAREKIIEYLSEAIFVLDTNLNIIDLNQSAKQLIENNYIFFTGNDIIGKSAHQVFNNISELQQLDSSNSQKIEIQLNGDKGKKIFEIEQSPITLKNDLSKGKTVMFRDVTKEKRIELKEKQRMENIHNHQKAISKIAKHHALIKGNKKKAFKLITETAAKQLHVLRASIWFLCNDDQELTCSDLYDLSNNNHSSGMVVNANKYPHYFRSLKEGRAIDAVDARSDKRTCEFREDYLIPLEIISMMDAPIWVSGKLVGVLCHEQVNEKREWLDYEISFAGELADQIAQVILNAEREQVMLALRESELKYRTIFENTGTAIGTFGEDGIITMVNSEFERLSGYAKNEIEYKMHWYDFVAEKDRRKMYQYHKKRTLKYDTPPSEYDFTFIDRLGKVKSVHICISLIPHSFIRIFSLIDITELKVTYRKLQKLNNTLEEKVKQRTTRIHHLLKQKDDFVNQLGHDLKNPLGPLVTLLPIIERHVKTEKDKEILKVIQRNVGYMKNLVQKTLELARLNSPNTVLNFEPVNLKEHIDNVIQRNTFLFEGKKISVSSNIPVDLIVYVDVLRLEELFNNLLTNAVKYNNECGSIGINASADDEKVTVFICDDGQGMTPDQLFHAFDEFYKADESRHNIKSSGLGMSICKRIVEKHGGTIWAESDGLDKGSTFYFTLPLYSPKQSEKNNRQHKLYLHVANKVDTLLKK